MFKKHDWPKLDVFGDFGSPVSIEKINTTSEFWWQEL
jgi:hypothetical protein